MKEIFKTLVSSKEKTKQSNDVSKEISKEEKEIAKTATERVRVWSSLFGRYIYKNK